MPNLVTTLLKLHVVTQHNAVTYAVLLSEDMEGRTILLQKVWRKVE